MEEEYNMPGEKQLLESVVKFISPRKVILKESFYGGKDLHCGSCNNIVGGCDCYCKHCGQKLEQIY